MSDLLIVGAGLYGLTLARVLAEHGRTVRVIDRRPHLGGNAYDERDPDTGILVHRYGTHIFHTSNERVYAEASRFTGFNDYRHHVFTVHAGEVYPLPVSLATINQFLRASLSPREARAWVAASAAAATADPTVPPESSLAGHAVRTIGPDLYRAFIEGYTRKQWATDPRLLPAAVLSRLPVRFTYETRYFTDTYEGIPSQGYTAWLSRVADHPRITIALDTPFDAPARAAALGSVPLIYSGPIDEFHGYQAGPLGWRTIDLSWETLPTPDAQGTAVLNYADDLPETPWTRVHEFRHLHPERSSSVSPDATVIAREVSRIARPFTADEPYYPTSTPADREALSRYRALTADLAASLPASAPLLLGGRLGSYAYLDIHQAMGSALAAADRIIKAWR